MNTKLILSAALVASSLSFEAQTVSNFDVISPCKEKLFGVFELGRATRLSAVEDSLRERLDNITIRQRFLQYDVEEIAEEISASFANDASKLVPQLESARTEYATTTSITLPSGRSLSGLAATEYIKILLSRHKAYVAGSNYLANIFSEVDGVRDNINKAVARLTVIDTLLDQSSSEEILSSACIAFKEVESLDIEFPFNDASTLKQHALMQSQPASEEELAQFLSHGYLEKAQSLTTESLYQSFSRWADGLLN